MSSRTFGVEIECGNRYHGPDTLARRAERAGFDIFGWTYDGSGVEIKSGIYSGREGLKQLRGLMEFLVGQGCYTTTRDGMHVHIGVPELESKRTGKEQAVKLVKSWAAAQDAIHEMFPNRRVQSAWCPPWRPQDIAALENNDRDWWWEGPHGALTLHPLQDYGTVEVRQHHGTLDADRAVAWVEFLVRFFDRVLVKNKQPIRKPDCAATIVKRVRVPKRHQPALLAVGA